MPKAPEHNVRLGVAHTWNIGDAALTARWDYYWQSESYARDFNAIGDRVYD